MSNSLLASSQPKKLFHQRNGSDELDVFEAARYFAGATENISGTRENIIVEARTFNSNTRPSGRMSLDMPNHIRDSIPLEAMLMENRMMMNKDKKSKQPSSPGGKLAHFFNSIFSQTSSKKTKSKTKSTKEEDESLGGWRRKRRSSISHFGSANSHPTTTATTATSTTTATTATVMSDAKSPFSTSASSGFRTPPLYVAHKPTKITSYGTPKSYSYLKPPPTQITKIPIMGNLKKIKNFNVMSDLSDKNVSFGNGFLEKVNICHEKQEDIKSFIDDDGADSDSSSDLFELRNCDLGCDSGGLPVYETTRVVGIKRDAPISC
ncbi:hypothetical protein SSX86_017531 [Deinandra increscens subsp. villosa]|uniref:Protein BIG GRAIN 1-like E n=1 Tax=Deinandra increscens subsp. villosa TaxID=3103831 RepID=A0AAP0GYM7_9ASTR